MERRGLALGGGDLQRAAAMIVLMPRCTEFYTDICDFGSAVSSNSLDVEDLEGVTCCQEHEHQQLTCKTSFRLVGSGRQNATRWAARLQSLNILLRPKPLNPEPLKP